MPPYRTKEEEKRTPGNPSVIDWGVEINFPKQGNGKLHYFAKGTTWTSL